MREHQGNLSQRRFVQRRLAVLAVPVLLATALVGVVTPAWSTSSTGDAAPIRHASLLAANPPLPSQALYGWGAQDWGQVGSGPYGGGLPTPSPFASVVAAPGGGTFSQVAAGGAHTLGLASGQVLAWGSNASGQLGIGSTTDAPTPQPVGILSTPVTAVAAGSNFSLALDGNGQIEAWGSNFFGQLGNGTSVGSTTPVLVPTPSGAHLPFTAIAAGGDHSLALDSSGQVWAWGANFDGQLGIGTNASASTPTLVPPATGAALPFKAIAAGTAHSLALDSNGQIWAWGLDASGQLGDGVTLESGVSHDETTMVESVPSLGPTTFTAIAAGSSHSIALTQSGTVETWGSDSFGQLGSLPGQSNTTGSDSSLPTPVPGLPPLFAFDAIAAGSNSSYALNSSGVLWVWGGNASGQLGVGTTQTISTAAVLPQAITDLPAGTLATQVSSGPDASAAFVVTRATQNITFPALPTPTYGDPQVGVAPTVDSGLPLSVVASGACAGVAARLVLVSAGTCTLVATQPGDFNHYEAQISVSFPVAQATLTIAPQNKSTTAGVAVPAYPYALSGFRNHDTTAVVSGTAACTSTAPTPPFRGVYPITCGQGSLSSPNYLFVSGPPATLTVLGPSSDYAFVGADGSVSAEAASTPPFFGSMAQRMLNAPVVGGAFTPLHDGYWLVASDGGIFTFGTAPFLGSMGGIHLNQPVVGIATTADGQGYWEVASDGGIFAFGDAGFYGSTGGQHLNRPIVGMAPSLDGRGYWLVASDGGIFAYGDAGFYGSTGGLAIGQPIVGMATAPDGGGYWLATSGGLVFNFGSATFEGSLRYVPLAAPIAGIAATADGGGYWLAGRDGGIFAFGNAGYYGRGPAPPGGVAGIM